MLGAAVDSVVGSYKPDMPPSWLHGGISREQAEGEVHTLNGAECMREASDSPDDSVTNQSEAIVLVDVSTVDHAHGQTHTKWTAVAVAAQGVPPHHMHLL